jgi:putative membrane protein
MKAGAGAARLPRAFLLIGFGLLIAKLFATGEMSKYMNSALDPLTIFAGALMTIMGAVELVLALTGVALVPHHTPGGDDGWLDRTLTYALVLLPLVLGLAVAPKALGTAALGGEALVRLAEPLLAAPAGWDRSAPPLAPRQPIDDVSQLLGYLHRVGEMGIGQEVHVIGLVARSDELQPNEFALLRFMIAHCVADARATAVIIVAPGDVTLPNDQWVEISGTLTGRELNGARVASILARGITPIKEPAQPYIQISLNV